MAREPYPRLQIGTTRGKIYTMAQPARPERPVRRRWYLRLWHWLVWSCSRGMSE